MWPELNRLARGSLIYGIGSVFQRFLGLLLLPFFTRVLSPQEYGVMALLGLVTVAVVGLFNLGTGSSMGVLYFEREDIGDRHKVIWSTALLLAANCTVLVALLMIAAPYVCLAIFQSAEHANLLRISLVSTAMTVVIEPFYAHLRYQEKAIKFVILTVIGAVFGASVSVVFVIVLGWGVAGLLLAGLLGQVLTAIMVAASVARHLEPGIDKSLFLPLVRIGFPSIFGLFAFLVIDYMDRQMLQRMIDLDAVGVYSVGYNLALVMLIAVSAFGMAWPPFFISFIKRQDEAKELFAKILSYYLIVFGMLTALFFVAARPLVAILAPEFAAAAQIIGLVAAAYMLKGVYLILLPGVVFAKKLHWQSAVEWAAALANIGLNLLLIPRLGIVGAAAATLASYGLMTILAWAVARRYLAVRYDWRRIVVAGGGLVAACAWISWASAHLSLAGLAIHSLLALCALFLVFGFMVLDSGERGALAARAAQAFQRS
ncbi:MAG: polysaccharide biosynthesis protein [Rhodobiaceae bacterium]|nr:polysaccharide biosynthesis protein [Rhodobiaceae bacterium]